jgi:hypothetical protein
MEPNRRGAEPADARLAGVGAARRLELPLLGSVPGLAHAFTVKGSDETAVLREAAGRTLPLVTLRQVHGASVVAIEDDDAPVSRPASARSEGDALAARKDGVALGVRVADCAPILICDPRSRAIAAVHAGWRGTVAGVLRAAISVLCGRFGARPGDLRLAIGPCIGPCCFEVGEEVVAALLAADPGAGTCVLPGRRARIDLAGANRRQALAAGLHADRIAAVALCTMCRDDLLESYRRSRGGAGRMAGLIGWRDGAGSPARI